VAQYRQQYEYTVSDVSGQWHSITSSMNTLCQMFQDGGTLSPAVWIHCVRCFRTMAQYHQQYEYTVSDVSGRWHSITSTMNSLCLMFQDNGTASPASSPGGWKWGSWRIPSEYLPLLVGAVCGGALILLIIIAAIVWRCCVVPRRDKAYCKSFLLYIRF